VFQRGDKAFVRVTAVVQFGRAPIPEHLKEVYAAKAEIGKAVHESIHEFVTGGCPLPAEKEMGYFKSFLRWNEELHPVFLETEQRYFDEDKLLTGCIDGIVQLGGGEPVLIDFKTSAKVDVDYWRAQAHLYRHLLTKNGKDVSQRMLFIQLNKHGELPHVEVIDYSEKTMRRCLENVDKYWTECVK